jgi:hypothetical protein
MLIIIVREKMRHVLEMSQMVTLRCQEEMVEESKESNDTSAAEATHQALKEEQRLDRWQEEMDKKEKDKLRPARSFFGSTRPPRAGQR